MDDFYSYFKPTTSYIKSAPLPLDIRLILIFTSFSLESFSDQSVQLDQIKK
jgi:hypothetical protein